MNSPHITYTVKGPFNSLLRQPLPIPTPSLDNHVTSFLMYPSRVSLRK